jgi:hypothetical protein
VSTLHPISELGFRARQEELKIDSKPEIGKKTYFVPVIFDEQQKNDLIHPFLSEGAQDEGETEPVQALLKILIYGYIII